MRKWLKAERESLRLKSTLASQTVTFMAHWYSALAISAPVLLHASLGWGGVSSFVSFIWEFYPHLTAYFSVIPP